MVFTFVNLAISFAIQVTYISPTMALVLYSNALHFFDPAAAKQLPPGDHFVNIMSGKLKRSCLVHIPKNYNPSNPSPIVLIFHGAGTNAAMTVKFTGMNKKSDEEGFIAVYPNGTGTGPFLTWNAGVLQGDMASGKPDDVAFIVQLLEDLSMQINLDKKRIYATGISNGAMMCYKLASEIGSKIAAIAPVAGTMGLDEVHLKKPLPVIHFHGTEDNFVPFNGPNSRTPKFMKFKSAEDTALVWAKANNCDLRCKEFDSNSLVDDGTKIKNKLYTNSSNGTEVHLVIIEGGGHTWPGMPAMVNFIGKSTKNISANDKIWEFFKKYQLH